MTYYAKVWTRGADVFCVQTDSVLTEHKSFNDWSDKVYHILIDGEYAMADIVTPLLKVSNGTLVSEELSFAILSKEDGIQPVPEEIVDDQQLS